MYNAAFWFANNYSDLRNRKSLDLKVKRICKTTTLNPLTGSKYNGVIWLVGFIYSTGFINIIEISECHSRVCKQIKNHLYFCSIVRSSYWIYMKNSFGTGVMNFAFYCRKHPGLSSIVWGLMRWNSTSKHVIRIIRRNVKFKELGFYRP